MNNRINYFHLTPEPSKQLMALSNELEKVSTIDKTIKHLIDIRVSQINGCVFCLDMHHKEARIHGERELRLYHMAAWRESPLFSEKERAALEWAELLTKIGEHGVSDQDFDKVRSFFSEKEVSDLTFHVAMINLWNRFGVAFRPTPGGMDKLMGLDKIGLT